MRVLCAYKNLGLFRPRRGLELLESRVWHGVRRRADAASAVGIGRLNRARPTYFGALAAYAFRTHSFAIACPNARIIRA